MNDNKKTSYHCHAPKNSPSSIYKKYDVFCRERSFSAGHMSHGHEHKISRRILRAKLKEETMNIIEEEK
jgi:hypothetical protein